MNTSEDASPIENKISRTRRRRFVPSDKRPAASKKATAISYASSDVGDFEEAHLPSQRRPSISRGETITFGNDGEERGIKGRIARLWRGVRRGSGRRRIYSDSSSCASNSSAHSFMKSAQLIISHSLRELTLEDGHDEWRIGKRWSRRKGKKSESEMKDNGEKEPQRRQLRRQKHFFLRNRHESMTDDSIRTETTVSRSSSSTLIENQQNDVVPRSSSKRPRGSRHQEVDGLAKFLERTTNRAFIMSSLVALLFLNVDAIFQHTGGVRNVWRSFISLPIAVFAIMAVYLLPKASRSRRQNRPKEGQQHHQYPTDLPASPCSRTTRRILEAVKQNKFS